MLLLLKDACILLSRSILLRPNTLVILDVMDVIGFWISGEMIFNIEAIACWIKELFFLLPLLINSTPLRRRIIIFHRKYREELSVLQAVLPRPLHVFEVFINESGLRQMIDLGVSRGLLLQLQLLLLYVTLPIFIDVKR